MAGAVAENVLLIKVAAPVNLSKNQPMAELPAPLVMACAAIYVP